PAHGRGRAAGDVARAAGLVLPSATAGPRLRTEARLQPARLLPSVPAGDSAFLDAHERASDALRRHTRKHLYDRPRTVRLPRPDVRRCPRLPGPAGACGDRAPARELKSSRGYVARSSVLAAGAEPRLPHRINPRRCRFRRVTSLDGT